MKKIFFIIALFASIFSAKAADLSIKKMLMDPWYLTVDNNEKIYVVKGIYKDSSFIVITQEDTLSFKEDPGLYYHQAFIMNKDTGEYEPLHRNSTITMTVTTFSVVIFIILILLQIAIHFVKKP
ncbi:MAG: hypothetical protein J6T72_03905 [Alphaproteobacteria bacterium]|nr:hypothetical protein [Alphaproteobacteria bacterium]